jgi:hypothetical protein
MEEFEATTPRMKSSIDIARGFPIVDAKTQTPTDDLKFREISRKLEKEHTKDDEHRVRPAKCLGPCRALRRPLPTGFVWP